MPRHHEPAVETYYREGAWHTGRADCPGPFASGPDREDLITVGYEVARWNAMPHVIRAADGTIAEINTYVTA
ncbi:hypothetical protein FB561_1275 [Kribbella amoyensis]|uniref:Uncharacterized protein n=1 Tax=Kribbella amoyensis TaxID=996641 RepID=A0A561BN27_9ACTN|nr:hypothetical protein [Kribbella amoyensis]TWD80202.1 hypothetical protein FB561_1275 [Kribbella amoyensis]